MARRSRREAVTPGDSRLPGWLLAIADVVETLADVAAWGHTSALTIIIARAAARALRRAAVLLTERR